MDIFLTNGDPLQKRLPRLSIAATRIIRRNATLVAPEDVDFAPIYLFTKIGSQ
jgi:hypothetical protein